MNSTSQFTLLAQLMNSSDLVIHCIVAVFCVAILAAVFHAIYGLLSLPMRRMERARIFLDLLEIGLRQARGVEQTIISASASRDPAPGVRFHLLAAHMERGLHLGEALDQVPRLLPSQIVATLKAGEELGDVARVIPACRTLLKDGISKTWAALHYLPLLIVVVLPMTFFILVMLQVFIWPKLVEISAGMGTAMPLGSFWIIRYGAWIDAFLLAMIGGLGLASVCFIGGPRLVSWTRLGLEPLVDRFYYCLPWHRKRLHRDFAGVLSVLLDAEVPEEKAVAIAASSTVNRVIIHKATRVCEALKEGRTLPEALAFLDDSREFRWHLANAAQGREPFWTALAGWRESLDAKAFQQEQAAAQLLTSLLIVANGVIVGLVVSSVFLFLISIIDEGLLW